MQIQFPISISSLNVGSISANAVAGDKVDMLVREENQIGQLMPEKRERENEKRACDVKLRQILWLTTGNTTPKILF